MNLSNVHKSITFLFLKVLNSNKLQYVLFDQLIKKHVEKPFNLMLKNSCGIANICDNFDIYKVRELRFPVLK